MVGAKWWIQIDHFFVSDPSLLRLAISWATLPERGITMVILTRKESIVLQATFMFELPRLLFISVAAFLICSAASAEPDLSGIWMLQGRSAERELVLTDEGKRIQAVELMSPDSYSWKVTPNEARPLRYCRFPRSRP